MGTCGSKGEGRHKDTAADMTWAPAHVGEVVRNAEGLTQTARELGGVVNDAMSGAASAYGEATTEAFEAFNGALETLRAFMLEQPIQLSRIPFLGPLFGTASDLYRMWKISVYNSRHVEFLARQINEVVQILVRCLRTERSRLEADAEACAKADAAHARTMELIRTALATTSMPSVFMLGGRRDATLRVRRDKEGADTDQSTAQRVKEALHDALAAETADATRQLTTGLGLRSWQGTTAHQFDRAGRRALGEDALDLDVLERLSALPLKSEDSAMAYACQTGFKAVVQAYRAVIKYSSVSAKARHKAFSREVEIEMKFVSERLTSAVAIITALIATDIADVSRDTHALVKRIRQSQSKSERTLLAHMMEPRDLGLAVSSDYGDVADPDAAGAVAHGGMAAASGGALVSVASFASVLTDASDSESSEAEAAQAALSEAVAPHTADAARTPEDVARDTVLRRAVHDRARALETVREAARRRDQRRARLRQERIGYVACVAAIGLKYLELFEQLDGSHTEFRRWRDRVRTAKRLIRSSAVARGARTVLDTPARAREEEARFARARIRLYESRMQHAMVRLQRTKSRIRQQRHSGSGHELCRVRGGQTGAGALRADLSPRASSSRDGGLFDALDEGGRDEVTIGAAITPRSARQGRPHTDSSQSAAAGAAGAAGATGTASLSPMSSTSLYGIQGSQSSRRVPRSHLAATPAAPRHDPAVRTPIAADAEERHASDDGDGNGNGDNDGDGDGRLSNLDFLAVNIDRCVRLALEYLRRLGHPLDLAEGEHAAGAAAVPLASRPLPVRGGAGGDGGADDGDADDGVARHADRTVRGVAGAGGGGAAGAGRVFDGFLREDPGACRATLKRAANMARRLRAHGQQHPQP